jgi:hypothetical protein
MSTQALAEDIQRVLSLGAVDYWSQADPHDENSLAVFEVHLSTSVRLGHEDARRLRELGHPCMAHMFVDYARSRLVCRRNSPGRCAGTPSAAISLEGLDDDARTRAFALDVMQALSSVGMYDCAALVRAEVREGWLLLYLTELPGVRDTVLAKALAQWPQARYYHDMKAQTLRVSVPKSEIPAVGKRKRA